MSEFVALSSNTAFKVMWMLRSNVINSYELSIISIVIESSVNVFRISFVIL